jgi:hypothetical protein
VSNTHRFWHRSRRFLIGDRLEACGLERNRAGFVDVPPLMGAEPVAEFEFNFDGTGCGLFNAAGLDDVL